MHLVASHLAADRFATELACRFEHGAQCRLLLGRQNANVALLHGWVDFDGGFPAPVYRNGLTGLLNFAHQLRKALICLPEIDLPHARNSSVALYVAQSCPYGNPAFGYASQGTKRVPAWPTRKSSRTSPTTSSPSCSTVRRSSTPSPAR